MTNVNQSEQDAISQMLEKAPLLKFSAYTHLQSEALQRKGQNICALLDSVLEDDSPIAWQNVQEVYDEFWFWVLGAYEVFRTMSDTKTGAKRCFSEEFLKKVVTTKKTLHPLRIAFAKQEIANSYQTIIYGEASIKTLDRSKRDLHFEVRNKMYSVKKLIGQVSEVLRCCTIDEVLASLRSPPPAPA